VRVGRRGDAWRGRRGEGEPADTGAVTLAPTPSLMAGTRPSQPTRRSTSSFPPCRSSRGGDNSCWKWLIFYATAASLPPEMLYCGTPRRRSGRVRTLTNMQVWGGLSPFGMPPLRCRSAGLQWPYSQWHRELPEASPECGP
jgi:hypothetical protein